MKPIILVLEDDSATLDEVCETLEDEGFDTLRAPSIEALTEHTTRSRIDLFLMDMHLPDGSGLERVKEIRRRSDVGIIIITGRAGTTDRIIGLEVGADDYVTKPFDPRELVARVRSVLRRTEHKSYYPDHPGHNDAKRITFNGWTLDLDAHSLTGPDLNPIALTTAEYDLLRCFVDNPNRVLSRDQLLNSVHGHDWQGYERGIDGLVSRLRKKIATDDSDPDLIKTVRGAGYMFTARPEKG